MADANVELRLVITGDGKVIAQLNKVTNQFERLNHSMRKMGQIRQHSRFLGEFSQTLRKALISGIGVTAVFGSIYAVINSIRTALGFVKDQIIAGVGAVAKFEEQTISLQGIIATTVKYSEDFITNFTQAGVVAEAVQRTLLLRSGEILGTAEQAGLVFQTFLGQGAANLVRNMEELVDLSLLFTNAILAVTPGQEAQRQLASETAAFLRGQVRATDRLAKLLGLNAEQLNNIRDNARTTKDFYDQMVKRLGGINEAAKRYRETWTGITTTIQNVIELVRVEAFRPLWDDIKNALLELLDYITKNSNTLIEKVIVFVSAVQVIFQNIYMAVRAFIANTDSSVPRIMQIIGDIYHAWLRTREFFKDFFAFMSVVYNFIKLFWNTASVLLESFTSSMQTLVEVGGALMNKDFAGAWEGMKTGLLRQEQLKNNFALLGDDISSLVDAFGNLFSEWGDTQDLIDNDFYIFMQKLKKIYNKNIEDWKKSGIDIAAELRKAIESMFNFDDSEEAAKRAKKIRAFWKKITLDTAGELDPHVRSMYALGEAVEEAKIQLRDLNMDWRDGLKAMMMFDKQQGRIIDNFLAGMAKDAEVVNREFQKLIKTVDEFFRITSQQEQQAARRGLAAAGFKLLDSQTKKVMSLQLEQAQVVTGGGSLTGSQAEAVGSARDLIKAQAEARAKLAEKNAFGGDAVFLPEDRKALEAFIDSVNSELLKLWDTLTGVGDAWKEAFQIKTLTRFVDESVTAFGFLRDTLKDVGQIVVGQIGPAFAQFMQTLASDGLGSALKSFGAFMGSVLIQVGSMLMSLGAAAIVIGLLSKIPIFQFLDPAQMSFPAAAVAMATGAGLIALGTAMGGNGNKSATKASAAGGAGGSTGGETPTFSFDQSQINPGVFQRLNNSLERMEAVPAGYVWTTGAKQNGGVLTAASRGAYNGSNMSAMRKIGSSATGGRG